MKREAGAAGEIMERWLGAPIWPGVQEINPKPPRETLPASSLQSTSERCRAFSSEIHTLRGSRLQVSDAGWLIRVALC